MTLLRRNPSQLKDPTPVMETVGNNLTGQHRMILFMDDVGEELTSRI